MTSLAKRATLNLAGALLITLALTALLTPAVSAADDTQPPTVPTDLRATSVTFTDVALAWNPSSDNVGVDGYRILVDSNWWSYSYQPDSGTVGNLLPGHTYSIAVQAQDHAGNVSPASAPITVSTPADTEPPTAPTELTSDFAANGIFGLTWVGSMDNADQTKYLKYDGYADGGLVYVASGNETSIYICLAPGTYTFVVRARDRSGNVSAPSNSITVTG